MSKQSLYANQFGGTLENLVISVFERWLKDACKNKLYINNNKCKNILIMSTVEFIAWANAVLTLHHGLEIIHAKPRHYSNHKINRAQNH